MSKVARVVVTCGMLIFLTATVFAGGFVVGNLASRPNSFLPQFNAPVVASADSSDGETPQNLGQTFSPFWEAWNLVHQEYVDQPVDDVTLMQGAIRGMMRALDDPHSSYMNPDEYEIATSDQSGELEGIGAFVEMAGDYLRIVSPMPGSPAEEVGILPGDLILMVDNQDIAGLDEFEIIGMVRGPAGSTVHLTLQRQGHDEPLEFDVVRAKIIIPSVESKLLDGNVAYVKINDFGERTTGELKTALRDLLKQKPAGLVLDLRGNPGGYLTTAIEVVSQFVDKGVVMREKYGDGREDTYDALGGGLATDIPMVVLIDLGSASASEIVAGAIQDLQRGTLVGETSYGKGSVQNWHPLQGNNGAVRVTIARWLTPEGRSINKLGITPDVQVELTEADREAQRDPQLDKAVELLTGGASLIPLQVWDWPKVSVQ